MRLCSPPCLGTPGWIGNALAWLIQTTSMLGSPSLDDAAPVASWVRDLASSAPELSPLQELLGGLDNEDKKEGAAFLLDFMGLLLGQSPLGEGGDSQFPSGFYLQIRAGREPGYPCSFARIWLHPCCMPAGHSSAHFSMGNHTTHIFVLVLSAWLNKNSQIIIREN